MRQQIVDRVAIKSDLTAARRRAQDDVRGSPAWDAAMAWVDDLEQELWRLDASQGVAEVPGGRP